MTRHELEAALHNLSAGQAVHVSYDLFSELFPPGEPDGEARQRALRLAMANDCYIENRTQKQEILFVKKQSGLRTYGREQTIQSHGPRYKNP